MSLLDIARDTLKDLPVSDILRERLSLALDLAAQAEIKHEETKAKLARSEASLERERLDHKQTREQLQRLQEEHSEEIRIHGSGVEFRRGKRTGGKWLPFCPKCHLPATGEGIVSCPDKKKCCWFIGVGKKRTAEMIAEL